MIEGIFGLPGRGKTYEAVRRLLIEADSGRQCFSVTPINHPNVMTIDYEDIIDPWLPPGLILLDEVHLVLSARSGTKLNSKWYEKLSQTRKDGHDLIYTSQHESRVLAQLRQNTNWGWITYAYGGNPRADKPPVLFATQGYEMHKIRRGKPAMRAWHFYSSRVARAYDTRYAVQINEANSEEWEGVDDD